jgi:hypothetical protein
MRRLFRGQKKATPKPPAIPYHEARYPDGLLCDDASDWASIVRELIARLRWFGEEVSPSVSKRGNRNQPLTTNDIQRILLSWLAGGSASQVAYRVSRIREPTNRI